MINIIPNKKADTEQLEKFIQMLNFKLPEDYVIFLKEYNGGKPEENIVKLDFNESLSFRINSFFGIGTEMYINDILWNMKILEGRVPKQYIPIAHTEGGDIVCMNLISENCGDIYLWLHEEERFFEIAPSFSGFFEIISPHNPDDDDLSGYEVIDVWIDPEFLGKINKR